MLLIRRLLIGLLLTAFAQMGVASAAPAHVHQEVQPAGHSGVLIALKESVGHLLTDPHADHHHHDFHMDEQNGGDQDGDADQAGGASVHVHVYPQFAEADAPKLAERRFLAGAKLSPIGDCSLVSAIEAPLQRPPRILV